MPNSSSSPLTSSVLETAFSQIQSELADRDKTIETETEVGTATTIETEFETETSIEIRTEIETETTIETEIETET